MKNLGTTSLLVGAVAFVLSNANIGIAQDHYYNGKPGQQSASKGEQKTASKGEQKSASKGEQKSASKGEQKSSAFNQKSAQKN
ncbi:MAG TPA: hypothetical protein DIS93_00135 [Bdellovibrionales bacterium]|nr:hypothetical protein [Bdellovibrionales bacterium]